MRSYSETTTIHDDVVIMSATGTAATVRASPAALVAETTAPAPDRRASRRRSRKYSLTGTAVVASRVRSSAGGQTSADGREALTGSAEDAEVEEDERTPTREKAARRGSDASGSGDKRSAGDGGALGRTATISAGNRYRRVEEVC